MIYRFIFDDQWFRTIPSVIIDARVGTPIAGKNGNVVESYIQAQLGAVITPDCLTYKIETNNGNLVAVLVLQPDGLGINVSLLVVRPAFQNDMETITGEISKFIASNSWVYDQ